MKIVIIGSKDFDSLEFHVHDSLTFLGHNVIQIDLKDVISISYRYNYWLQKFFSKYDKYIFNKIADRVIDERPELVVCTYRFIHPDCVKRIKDSLPKVKVIQLNPDALTTFQGQQIFASPYDAYFTKDPYIKTFMRDKLKLKTFYLPEAFNQRVHFYAFENRSQLEEKINIDVVCFGTIYPYRARMVNELLKAGVDIAVFGTPDRKFPDKSVSQKFRNEFITGERKAEVLLGSKIVFNNFHFAEIESANAKYFEIAGIGGFQLCDYKPILQEYSAIDVDQISFRTIDEAVEKINFFLQNKALRHELAEEQRQHFIANHTYDIRMQEMLKHIENI